MNELHFPEKTIHYFLFSLIFCLKKKQKKKKQNPHLQWLANHPLG
jgi:hypothetical protein